MASGNKITAKDIFDENIGVAYKNFTELNKEATDQLERMRRKVIQLNNALKKNKDLDGPLREVAEAARDTATAADKAEQEIKQLGQALDKTGQKAKKTKSGFASANKGMKKMGGFAKQLIGAAGLAGVAYQLVALTKYVYETSKALESMDLALSKVTKSSYEFDQAQEFLVKTSERLGLNLLKTAKRYNTFLAAAQQANLTQKETNDIFETFADVGANLALSSDEMGSIFLALEQMLSKGKVSTEELRRQLGEKLPGAMGIMADALEVSTGKLDEMLRKGLVLSEDALPKFAKQVEKTFGVDKSKRVETLAAAQERLTNSWVLLIDKINNEGSGLNTVFKTVFGWIEAIAERTTDWFEELGLFLNADLTGWERFVLLLKDTFGFDSDIDAVVEAERQNQIARDNLKIYQELVNVAQQYAKVTGDEDFNAGMFSGLIGDDGKINPDVVQGMHNLIEEYKKKLEQIKKDIKAEGDAPPLLTTLLGSEETIKTEGLKAFRAYDSLLDDLEARRDRAAEILSGLDFDNEDDLNFWTSVLDNVTGQIDALKGQGQVDTGSVADLQFYNQGAERRRNGGGESTENENQGTILGGLDDLEAWGERLKAVQSIADAIFEIEEAEHQARLDRIKEEEDAVGRKYDKLYRLAEGDADAMHRLQVREQEERDALEKKRRKVEREGAIQRKKQAQVDAIIQAALASIQVWTKPGFPGAIPLQAVILGTLAASLSAIGKTHIPAYAEGTENHKGGLAVVGDGGKKEVIIQPDGSAFITGDTPELVDMPKGSKVMSDANDYINTQMMKAIMESDRSIDQELIDEVTKAVQKGFKGVNMNTNVTVKNSADYLAYRNRLLN